MIDTRYYIDNYYLHSIFCLRGVGSLCSLFKINQMTYGILFYASAFYATPTAIQTVLRLTCRAVAVPPLGAPAAARQAVCAAAR